MAYCCSCATPMSHDPEIRLVEIMLIVPGEYPVPLSAAVCWACHQDYKNDSLAPVIESMISARITRQIYPDKRFNKPC